MYVSCVLRKRVQLVRFFFFGWGGGLRIGSIQKTKKWMSSVVDLGLFLVSLGLSPKTQL